MQEKHSETSNLSWLDVYAIKDIVDEGIRRQTKKGADNQQCWGFVKQLLAVEKNVDYKKVLMETDNIVMALNTCVKQLDKESPELHELIRK